jgi:hypothetical protein
MKKRKVIGRGKGAHLLMLLPQKVNPIRSGCFMLFETKGEERERRDSKLIHSNSSINQKRSTQILKFSFRSNPTPSHRLHQDGWRESHARIQVSKMKQDEFWRRENRDLSELLLVMRSAR